MNFPMLDPERLAQIADAVAEMRYQHGLMYPYALNERGELIKFDAAGADQRYFCTEPDCVHEDGSREPLSYVSKSESGTKSAYFKHKRGSKSCTESILHREARRIIASCDHISLPPLLYSDDKFFDKSLLRNSACNPLPITIHKHQVPDGELDIKGRTVIVEITFQHDTKQSKIRTLGELGFPVLEIDIDRKTGFRHFQDQNYEHYVLDRAPRRWLYHPDIDSTSEPGEDDPFWMDAFAVQYKRRLSGDYGYTNSETDPVLMALEDAIGDDLHDANITSGWFTISPRAWQLHVIRHKLLEMPHAFTSDYEDVYLGGDERYPFLDARDHAVTRHAKSVRDKLDRPLTEPREDLTRACQSLLQRQRIKHESRTRHSFGVVMNDLSRLIIPYRILKAVWSIIEEGVGPLVKGRPDDLVRWSREHRVGQLPRPKLMKLMQRVERYGDTLRRGEWDGEDKFGLPSRCLDKWIIELRCKRLEEERLLKEARRRIEEEKRLAAREAERLEQQKVEERVRAERERSAVQPLLADPQTPLAKQDNFARTQTMIRCIPGPPPGFPAYDHSVLLDIQQEDPTISTKIACKRALWAFAKRSSRGLRYATDRSSALEQTRINYVVDEETLYTAITTYD